MGRRLSDSRRIRVLSDLADRLQRVLPNIAISAPGASMMAARILEMILSGGEVRITDPMDPAFMTVLDTLDLARKPDAPAGAMAAWVNRYLDPASATCLPGAKGLWTRAVNLERDRARRAASQSISVPARITLSREHRQQLSDLQKKHPGEPVSRLIGHAIGEQHHRPATRKPKPAGPTRPTTLELKLFG